jgi:hypothetical protein
LLYIVLNCQYLVEDVDNLNAPNGDEADALTSSTAPGLSVPIPTLAVKYALCKNGIYAI